MYKANKRNEWMKERTNEHTKKCDARHHIRSIEAKLEWCAKNSICTSVIGGLLTFTIFIFMLSVFFIDIQLIVDFCVLFNVTFFIQLLIFDFSTLKHSLFIFYPTKLFSRWFHLRCSAVMDRRADGIVSNSGFHVSFLYGFCYFFKKHHRISNSFSPIFYSFFLSFSLHLIGGWSCLRDYS